MRKQCRIWWLKHLSSTEPSSSYTFLFGWFVSCTPASLDIVVALARDDSSLSGCQSSLKEILCDTNGSMAVTLQGKSMFSLLGQCAVYPSDNDQLFRIGVGDSDQRKYYTCGTAYELNREEIFTVFLNRITYIGMGDRCCIAMSVYVILYETPRYGAHHFSLSFWNSSEKVKIFLKKHKWIDELHQKQPLNFGAYTILVSYALSNNTCYGFQARCLGLSRVEYAEKAALHKHSMWSSLAVDVLLLKGVHAGFKLNTELAGVLGMISLHAIQIWSALWFFMDALLLYLVKGLAMLGILFGMTVPAAFIRDMIVLVTLHVSTLHWVMSLLYSQQITSISSFMALVQLFIQYTLKQHIVGSLIFTPLLLLLPTSVFYIFFTMMNSSISLVCMLIEVVISIMHATPYINIELWLVRRRRFPAGIWFEIVSCHGSSDNPPEIVSLDTISSPSKNSLHLENISGRSHVLVSILHSNFLTVGEGLVQISHFFQIHTAVTSESVDYSWA
ncbi:N-acetylglucosaminyl transferase component family protein / Gpi1 family protein [Citrus sinensis]|uniref:N-acetylglucosaminyl transferase component family protein / Gpi1 family protein n=1 Tax=Citrus sinensis TaxID=2711 RepID=A0ACB8JP69_CITSI|nr:N-acetylglucosaminyl transferase component family protein / Gpi1 family protein [Citrus sinensis]